MISDPLAEGVIDVHAHWLPTELFHLPPGAPYGRMHDRGGELHLGDIPLSIPTRAMSDVPAILEDMRATGVGVRVLSAPPFAFPVGGVPGAGEYVTAFNDALSAVVSGAGGRLVGLGLVSLGNADEARAQMERLARTDGIAGIAIPPLLAGRSLDQGVLRRVLTDAADLDLAVLVHPMQLSRPEWSQHYLSNLVGNPVESATAVAALILGGVKEQLPRLRICFVHGGGCAPWLLGRWTHGWRTRADVRRHSTRPPAEVFGELFFDSVTHDPGPLGLLAAQASKGGVVCGSDYPFDMAQPEPVRFATDHGPDAGTLTANARAFLGL
ncbi:2-hydroxy-3-carboxy-6-oxo-7-methylocta-2,4-dienoate decarboxylase [Streptomyces violaceusniger]|uniref:Amidohydrolase family protein n=2 Tax=Streptomyces violaceusniger group TaxID=2839105 RepID=A0ABD5J4G5_9ACTN|nr:amidohydrolase family protein [Streptomyces violaceusniger]KUL44916.1 2-hydroxy-3-carboxy-6-oxo-7-methylocta-2,4-dienoate decarboxylase [Streptomyces violaceusniger]MEE4583241.1 amidohydrolase family protein [Streptomyces sp. DSM 41602]